jgi:hypothetical protein
MQSASPIRCQICQLSPVVKTDAFAEKQCRCKPRACFDTHAACCAVTRAGAVNDGREAVVCAVGTITEFAQGMEQWGPWSLVHARDTAHAVGALAGLASSVNGPGLRSLKGEAGALSSSVNW